MKNLQKDQWYTVADVKILGTCPEGSPIIQKLNMIKEEHIAMLDNCPTTHAERVYRWTGRRQ